VGGQRREGEEGGKQTARLQQELHTPAAAGVAPAHTLALHRRREYDALADDFVVLGLLPQGSDREKIVPALTGVFQAAMAGGVSNLSFGDLSGGRRGRGCRLLLLLLLLL
jgi:hypothetical protein